MDLLMGNQAVAFAAIKAGAGIVCGYPGTPSSEILQTVAENNPGDIYVEWSVNEKAAVEVAAGAAYAGVRAMVTMKQVGLNVAADPVMSLAYIGVKGGLVIVVADDPGPISSQTEQDTRLFGIFSKLPVFDPSSPEEAYTMAGEAFEYSEKYNIPVILRPTTRVCHGYANMELDKDRGPVSKGSFIKDSKWTIFPRLSYENHIKLEHKHKIIADDFSKNKLNQLKGKGKKGIVAGGIGYAYACEALDGVEGDYKLFKVSTPNPFPNQLALEFLQGLEQVLVIEELDPVIEKELIFLCGKHRLDIEIKGKLSGHMPDAGEYGTQLVSERIAEFLETFDLKKDFKSKAPKLPKLPVRPPVLCAGCPHRASFYAVKQAMKGKKAVFSGDIGCYTLGNAKPLEMVDTCLCMGAGITIAQGLQRAEPDGVNFAFIGDSTFFHTGIPGVINAVYNKTDIVLVVLDNSTTAMTGNQPHPGTGETMLGGISKKIDISAVLKAVGVEFVKTVNPFELNQAIAAIKEAAEFKGISAVIFKAKCIALFKPEKLYKIDRDLCTGCGLCISKIGCPAIVMDQGKAKIDASLCYGCSLCENICPVNAIGGVKK